MPFGQGDTPLKEVLVLIRREKYDFPVCIEYVGPDGPPAELTRCFDYCKTGTELVIGRPGDAEWNSSNADSA